MQYALAHRLSYDSSIQRAFGDVSHHVYLPDVSEEQSHFSSPAVSPLGPQQHKVFATALRMSRSSVQCFGEAYGPALATILS